MTSAEIDADLREIAPKLLELKRRYADQDRKVKELRSQLIDGEVESLPSEAVILHSLGDSIKSAQNTQEGLLAAYESAILSEISEKIADNLRSAVEESGNLFDAYIAVRKDHGILGRSNEEIARHLLRQLNLNYVSGHLASWLCKRFRVTYPV